MAVPHTPGAGDDDMRAALPDPPPPAPMRREAAIAAAMARFDGRDAAMAGRQAKPAGWWTKIQRPQYGAFAAAALVAMISLPLAWTVLDPEPDTASEASSPTARDAPARTRVHVDVAEAPAASAPPIIARSTQADAAAESVAAPEAKPAPARTEDPPPAFAYAREDRANAEIADALPPPPPPPPPPPRMAQRAAAPAAPPPPAAVASVSAAEAARDDGGSIVVTGARRAGSRAAREATPRGDWNACTVDDPGRSLARCGRLARAGAGRARSSAEGHVADGLAQAWRGDTAAAVAAFDRAIAIDPKLATAYLNRGLLRDREGDPARAIADLDRAVQYAPKAARGYYQRSLLLRKSGDSARADADAQRAVELDARYQAVVD